MKQAYTQFVPPLKVFSKAFGVTPEDYISKDFHKVMAAQYAKAHPEEDAALNAIKLRVGNCALYLDLQIIQGKCCHVFCPGRGFMDWLVECCPAMDHSHASTLMDVTDSLSCVLHFPTNAKLFSIAFHVYKTGEIDTAGEAIKNPKAIVSVNASGCSAILPASKALYGPIKNPLKVPDCWVIDFASIHDDPWIDYYSRLICGLGMYASCFPETVKTGPPVDLKHPSHHKYKEPKWIGISEKISLGGTHASPIAHFRKGHFRVLKSEKFTKKRFQAVFVSETFVNKAKAKTVLSPEEVTA